MKEWIVKLLAGKLGASWRTSILGIALILIALGNAAVAILDNNPDTKFNWEVTSVAIAGGWGLLKARDKNVSTEQEKASAPGNKGYLTGAPPAAVLAIGLGMFLVAVSPIRAQEESIITPLPLLVPEKDDHSALDWEFLWQNIDSLLTLTKRISVDAGMAAHFNKASELYASTGQSFTLLSLRRGRWKWEAIQWVHADTFFPNTTEDEVGVQTTLLRLPMPPPATTVLEAPGRAITTATRGTANVDNSFIAFDSFKIGGRVFSATDAWFNGQIGTRTTGYAIFGSFDIGR